MEIQTLGSKPETVETPVASAERCLSQIRLFLTFRKAAGQETARDEFLLDTLAEMNHRLYGKGAAVEVFPASQAVPEFESQVQGL